MEFSIGKLSLIAGLTFPKDCRAVAKPGCQIAIKAVVRDVCFPAGEPLGKGFFPNEGFGKRLEPMQFIAGEVGPELGRIGSGLIPKCLIFVERFDASLLGKLGRRREPPLFMHDCVDLPSRHCLTRHRLILSKATRAFNEVETATDLRF